MPTDSHASARDFFFELMKDSQRLHAGALSERDEWLRSLAIDGREEILFEFEMLLRGVERFFNLHDAPLDTAGAPTTRDFMEELKAVRDAVSRAIRLARFLLDPPSDRREVFRKYLESRHQDERGRRELVDSDLEQRTPQESLTLLRQGFLALRGVLDQLQTLDKAGHQLFVDVGQLALWHIGLNRYFRPFRSLEFRPEYDRLKNVRILEILKDLEPGARRPASIAFLALFRLLHYLRYVPGPDEAATRRSQVVLALVRSEISALAAFLEGDLAASIAVVGAEMPAQAVRLAQSVRKEAANIVQRELTVTDPPPPPGAGGRARNGFESMCRRAIAELACAFDPGVEPEELFDAEAEGREQGRRLRTDIAACREICAQAEQAFLEGDDEELPRMIAGLRACAEHFRNVSFQLLRYADYAPFERFLELAETLDTPPESKPDRMHLAEECNAFRTTLDQTFEAVSRRGELAGDGFDPAEAQALAARFLEV